MGTIKFSHKYLKLTSVGEQARLMQVVKIKFSELSGSFIEYDTKYLNEGKFEYYPLPKSGLGILMIFINRVKKVFTTVRPFNPQKWDYYKKQEGKMFDIEIGGKKDEAVKILENV